MDSQELLVSVPIPSEMPPHALDRATHHVQDIGEPLAASFFTQSTVNPSKWYDMLASLLF
jgi:hypothetical protein